MKMWVFRYTHKKFVRKLIDSWALWEDCLFNLDSKAKLALFRAFILSHFQYCSAVWYHCYAPNAWCMEKIQERALKCVYSNHTASYESLLNKARLPSLEVGRQMNIAIQTFKIVNDLSPTYLLELIKKRCRTLYFKKFWKYSENSSHEEGATWNKFLLLFGPHNLELFSRGIENYQSPENF